MEAVFALYAVHSIFEAIFRGQITPEWRGVAAYEFGPEVEEGMLRRE
jgi:hypothetical protein